MGNFRWAFLFSIPVWALSLSLFAIQTAIAADPPVNQGAGTYVPSSALSSPAVQQRLTNPTNAPPASGTQAPTNIGQLPTPDTIPAPTNTDLTNPSLGQYRNSRKEVNITKMFLDRYKHSVVRVIARDLAGNELARAMGVGVGRNAPYIATALSLVLGNEQQWADRIEITHHTGNTYSAKIALIDEEKNLVLLAPEANPAPLPYVPMQDERPQVDVFTFSFADGPDGKIEPQIQRGQVAAANSETGLLSLSSTDLSETQAGTAIINTQGELMGMLLPKGRGVLASTLQKLAQKAQRTTPLDPIQIGVILGRGVLVDPKNPNAFQSITLALDAIKKGVAPKADPARYTPAKDKAVAPKESTKVVIKVMPGIYRESKPIILPANISLSGSGPDRTVLIGTDPEKPLLLFQGIRNSMVSGFRLVPATLQKLKAPTIILSKTQNITLLGNVIEAKGGVGVWAHESSAVKIQGNAFARGISRGFSCDKSDIVLENNAFVGDWPTAVSVDRACHLEAKRNLFFENKEAISVSSLSGNVRVSHNSFIRTSAGVKVSGAGTRLRLDENIFYECPYAILVSSTMPVANIGRNVTWRSKIQAQGRALTVPELVRTEPKFVAPESYDFRLRPGQGQLISSSETSATLGAFQQTDFIGPYTQQLVRALAMATGEKELASLWGLVP